MHSTEGQDNVTVTSRHDGFNTASSATGGFKLWQGGSHVMAIQDWNGEAIKVLRGDRLEEYRKKPDDR